MSDSVLENANEASATTSKMSSGWFEQLEKIAAEVAEREGCYLYDLQMTGVGQGRTLQIFIDKNDSEGQVGIGIEDCSNVSKGLNLVLDESDLVPGGAYSLEVSSPGMDRKLKKPWHFQKVVGKKIWIRTNAAFEAFGMTDKKWAATKQLEMALGAATETHILFELKEGTLQIPYAGIEKAHLVFEIKKESNKKGHPKKS